MVTKVKTPRLTAQDKSYMVQDDVRVMQQAARIQADPKRMSAAKKEADAQIKALAKLAKG